MATLFIKCWSLFRAAGSAASNAGIKQAAAPIATVRRYRRYSRVGKAAGAAFARTTARKALIWKCFVVGGIGALGGGWYGGFPDLGDGSASVEQVSPRIEQSLSGTTSPFAFIPPGAGTDEPLFFALPPGHEADFSLPPGTVEIVLPPVAFAPVPDIPPAPTVPGPEAPPEKPTPVPEPSGLLLLATAVVVTLWKVML